MQSSARNAFTGTVSAVHSGAVNDEVELSLKNGQSIVASITKTSTGRLGLAPGKEAVAMIKASMVVLMQEAKDYLLSTRNQFDGVVKAVTPGAVNAEVIVEVAPGMELAAIVTMGSVNKMQLKIGSPVTAIFKAPSVILAVKK